MPVSLTLKQGVWISGTPYAAGTSVTVEESLAAQLIFENKAERPAGWNEYPSSQGGGGGGFTAVPHSTTLVFDGVNKEMPQTAITGPTAYTSTGSTVGTQINVCRVADGTNIPTFPSNFKEATGSSGFDNTANVKNYYQFIYTNNKVIYSVFQEVGDTGAVEATVPSQVTGLTVGTITSSSIAVSWTAPSNGGAAITDYIVQTSPDNSTWTTFADGTSTTTNTIVTGIPASTLRYIRVAAINSVGTGTYSTSVSATTNASATAPAQVTGLTLGTPTSTTQPLTWTAPSNGGSAITDYLIEYKATSSGTWLTFSDGTGTTTSTTVTGLTASTSYDYRVSAVNAVGTGTASATGTGSTASAGGDASYNSVMILLHGDGADGSTTFTDNSPSPITFTRFNNPTISTTQSKFGGASMKFDTAGNYLGVNNTNNTYDIGTQDYTMECWAYITTGTGNKTIISGSDDGGNHTNTLTWRIGASTIDVINNGVAIELSHSYTMPTNTWVHLAISRVGTNLRLFIDGVLVATVTNSTSVIWKSKLLIGNKITTDTLGQFYGYIDDLRVTRGVGRYTSTFTIPTAAYPNSL